MKEKIPIKNSENIMALFFILILVNMLFFIILFYPNLDSQIRQILFYFGFFGYAFLIAFVLSYYVSKVNSWLNKNEFRKVIFIAILIALAHAIFTGLKENSWISFLAYLAGDGLIIFLGQFGYNKWKKGKKHK